MAAQRKSVGIFSSSFSSGMGGARTLKTVRINAQQPAPPAETPSTPGYPTGRRLSKDSPHVPSNRKEAFQEESLHFTEYFRTHLYQSEKPRQLLFLGIFLVAVSFISTYSQEGEPFDRSLRIGLCAGAFLFTVYCILQVSDGLMVRPHPAFWRVIHGLGVVYLVCLAALNVMPLSACQDFVRFFSGEAGIPYVFKGHDVLDCQVSEVTIKRQLTSIWFTSHVIGWFCIMLIFRHFWLCFFASVFFEVVEVTLQFQIPEFRECWWDSIFMDTFGANLMGLILGQLFMNRLNLMSFEWAPNEDRTTMRSRIKRFFECFTPYSWQNYEWEFFSSPVRLSIAIMFMLILTAMQMNGFYFFHILGIPAANFINKIRLLIIFFLGFPGMSEYHAHAVHKTERLGSNSWLYLAVISMEFMFIGKYVMKLDHFKTNFPHDLLFSLALAVFFLLIWALLFFTKINKVQSVAFSCLGLRFQFNQNAISLFAALPFLCCLFYPFRYWKWD